MALLQIGSLLLLVLLVIFLVYVLYDSQVRGTPGVVVSASDDGTPRGRVMYITKGQFRRERDR
ncbi:hypothetical protein GOP47_0002966 [Adiantum capillus-veneris]|uniref:Uncharacterized protein n=1 Tax=Adiantum capillus-veneris TaxID=13818 RepID=A0A9D4VCT2_ADICA|nr:hypothetical protein GOP47_0002966 [Adiantum capillus-veneris]